MDGEIVWSGLEFPEGPVWHQGALYCVEMGGAGRIARCMPEGKVERIAETGGGPNGATLGPDGMLYVTQNGGMREEGRVTPAILRITLDGKIETVTSEVNGLALEGPNDLAFAPDGRLYFTDPRGSSDPAKNKNPGRIFAWDVAEKSGELVLELGPVFPNGIAFDAQGTLFWSESFSRRVMALRDGYVQVECELPDRHFPDGFCFDQQGRLYVGTTYAHCVSVIEEGRIIDRLMCADGMPTNCCFGGTDLYVTDSRHGKIWRFPVGREGLALR
ncbi:MAG TPA: SMP-30/gluconolactonase/LRE family protein [Polyangiales bacterium]|nr:SMP-30/gluconolactonase/LRE family protein [Polyangiales bacterium]